MCVKLLEACGAVNSQLNLNLRVLVFVEVKENRRTYRKTLGERTKTNSKLNSHTCMLPGLGFDVGVSRVLSPPSLRHPFSPAWGAACPLTKEDRVEMYKQDYLGRILKSFKRQCGSITPCSLEREVVSHALGRQLHGRVYLELEETISKGCDGQNFRHTPGWAQVDLNWRTVLPC